MDVYTGTVSIDVCTTTTPHSRLLHHVSSGSMRVAPRFKCLSDSYCNLHRDEKKEWRTRQNPFLVR